MQFCLIGEKSGGMNPWRVGGIESYCRRIGAGLAAQGNSVVSLVHGDADNDLGDIVPGYSVREYADWGVLFRAALDLRPACIAFGHIRKTPLLLSLLYRASRVSQLIEFYFFDPPHYGSSRLKVMFYHRLIPSVCIGASPAICDQLQAFGQDPLLLLPPVPDDFFVSVGDKRAGPPFRVGFIGRIGRDKGFHLVLQHFREAQAALSGQFNFSIHGYYDEHNAESMQLADDARRQENLSVHLEPLGAWSLEREQSVKQFLREADLLYLPYLYLQDTLATPLLVLEGLAALDQVIVNAGVRLPGALQDMVRTVELDTTGGGNPLLAFLSGPACDEAFSPRRRSERLTVVPMRQSQVVTALLEHLRNRK